MNKEVEAQLVYPIIKTEKEVDDMINENLSETRKKLMIEKIDQMKQTLEHYDKVKKKWTVADSSIQIIGLTLAAATAITASVLSAGAFAPPIVAGVLSGVAALKTILTESISIGFTSRKKKIYRERCELVRDYINKLFVFSEMCKEDKIITIDELNSFMNILKEFREKLLGINLNNNGKDNGLEKQIEGTFISSNVSELQKQYNTLTKKEVKQVVKDHELNELKKKLTGSQLTLPVVKESV